MSFNVDSVLPMSIFALNALDNLPTDFTNTLSTIQFQQVLEAFAHLDFVSKGTKNPKLFQLKALVSLLAGRNVILRAETVRVHYFGKIHPSKWPC
ncbi:uncharacterized protein BJ212DRAFT_1354547 [Suillus subaureus]|uniref:Uncharacterized protein n=1 Tax=Suillus subaureus TaxID=48587 RepID=A0A9P7EAW4_9AGAM|nr:uncharacterized protein BJ212DRAFT_1354547 [Suillus subaureus]KAG1816392.1 hypothetical protein BJ212DRAFT_1354547 [Suillus subaureus]